MAKLSWQERRELKRCFGFALLIFALFSILFFLDGCAGTVRQTGRYMPGENYDRNGESCGTINQPKQWLKPCE